MPGQLPAARTSDPTTHGTPTTPGPGSPTVEIDGHAAWRAMTDTHLCPAPGTPHGPEKIYLGSTTVLINNQMACRMADILQGLGPPNFVEMGSKTVLIGDNGFGMGREEPKQRFAEVAQELLRHWDEIRPEERLATLGAALNAVLPFSMPLVKVEEDPSLPPETFGQFSFEEWAVQLNSDFLNDQMDRERMTNLVNTTYHEGRHCEQWWNVAQFRAGQGCSAREIQKEMRIPMRVARVAVNHPVQKDTSEGVMGRTVHTSVYGSRRTYRNRVISNLATDTAYQQYRALPEEEDAWRHGDCAGIEFKSLAGRVVDGREDI